MTNIPFQRPNAIVEERRAVRAGTALRLDALTRSDAEVWLRVQVQGDLWHASRARALPRRA